MAWSADIEQIGFFSKGYYLKKTLLYTWANMVNRVQLAQEKVRDILK